jgi:1-acyl-sn-glycerol-3-phosphate acyltransferase
MIIYPLLKILVRLGFRFYYRKTIVSYLQQIPKTGPVLLVANHPSSFMDALLIAVFAKRPMHFLARGDAFNNRILAAAFRSFNMLPVYRISEGKENLDKNFETFDAVHEALTKNEMVLIFGEGISENNWDLRKQKKGAARIILRAWKSNTPAKNTTIVPVGLTYEHFKGAGKSVVVNYGKTLHQTDFNTQTNAADFVQLFNNRMVQELQQLAYFNPSIQQQDAEHLKLINAWQLAESNQKDILTVLKQEHWLTSNPLTPKLFSAKLPLLFWLWPHYKTMQIITQKATNGNIFYDSVLFGLTLLLAPFYLATIWFVLRFLMM